MHGRVPDSEALRAVDRTAPMRQRSNGHVRLQAGPAHPGGATRIIDLAESGPSRLRFPRGNGALEAVLVNTRAVITSRSRSISRREATSS
mgnify:CR=1 FL=1